MQVSKHSTLHNNYIKDSEVGHPDAQDQKTWSRSLNLTNSIDTVTSTSHGTTYTTKVTRLVIPALQITYTSANDHLFKYHMSGN